MVGSTNVQLEREGEFVDVGPDRNFEAPPERNLTLNEKDLPKPFNQPSPQSSDSRLV
jgi:hypothetical protein